MAGYSIASILETKTVIGLIAKRKTAANYLSALFGWNIGGSTRRPVYGREFTYDTYEPTRTIATARRPLDSSHMAAPQKIGTVRGVFPRAAETIPLEYERITNQRAAGDPSLSLDRAGESYILRQVDYLAKRFENLIEFQTAAMLRGSYTFDQQGDALYQGFSGGTETVDFQVPSANKTTLGGIINGAGDLWSNSASDIPGQLLEINDKLLDETGFPLKHVIISSVAWNYVIGNTKVKAVAGSVNRPYEEFQLGVQDIMTARIAAMPWVTFHIVDHRLDVWNGSSVASTKLIPDNRAAFLPEISAEWCEYLDGSEVVTEVNPVGGAGTIKDDRYGLHAWNEEKGDPARIDLKAVHNGIPSLLIPKCINFGSIAA